MAANNVITTTIKNRMKLGNARMNVVDIEFDEVKYATGGISISAAKFGLGAVFMVHPAPSGGYVYEYDHGNRKLKVFEAGANGLAEVAAYTSGNGIDASIRCIAIGV